MDNFFNDKIPMLLLAVSVSLLSVLLKVFDTEVFEALFVLVFPLYLVNFVAFVAVFILSVVYIFVRKPKLTVSSLLPLFVMLLAIGVIFFVPTTSAKLDINFSSKLAERKQVIDDIRAGRLIDPTIRVSGSLKLPNEYRNVSRLDNTIEYDSSEGTLEVLFYTFVGIPDGFAGFVYVENNEAPSSGTFACGYVLDQVKYQDHWYWISCT